MKKFFVLVLTLCFVCSASGCMFGPKTQDLPKTMAKIEAQIEMENMMDLKLEDLESICYIDKADVKQFAAKINNTGIKSEEIILIEAKDSAAKERIYNALSKRQSEKITQAASYNPSEMDVPSSLATRKDAPNFVHYIISPKMDEIDKIFNDNFR